jgi:hypothetical protein
MNSCVAPILALFPSAAGILSREKRTLEVCGFGMHLSEKRLNCDFRLNGSHG